MTQIKLALTDFNPWWNEKFELEFNARDIYAAIKEFIPLRQIIAFTGLRRVGKTTLMYKIIADFIEKGTDPKNIIYFSFDDFKGSEMSEIIKVYEELMEKDFKKEKYLIVLDEVQKLENWENQLKIVYDMFKNVKIIISGSESLFIRKKSKESLAGRIFVFKVEPLSFKEFLNFRKVKFEPIGIYEKELLKLFTEFTLSLGFPELVNTKNKEIIKKYIQEGIVEKVLYRDFSKLFKIKDISVIESLLNIFMEEPGQIIDLSELSNDLKISRQTLSTYLNYLEQSFLIKKLYNYSKNRRKIERKLKKYYPCVISVDLLFKDDDLSRSRVFEWMIINQLKADFFWRDPYKHEVDVVLTDKKTVPVEIKYGKVDLAGINAFMKAFCITNGTVVTREREETQKVNEKVIELIPAFKFLLKNKP